MIVLENLDTMPFADLCDKATVADLKDLSGLLSLEEDILKQRKEKWYAIMVRKFGERGQAALSNAGKDTGTVHIPASNTLEITVEVPKTVKWDQVILRKALAAMSPADANHYGKVKIEVEERKFSAAPPATKTALARARTVVPGKMKFTFKDPADADDYQQEAA